jgi:hemolysin activation/secretion protein
MPTLARATFGAAFLLFSFSAKAQQSAVNEQDWITRNQQNIIEETTRSKELEAIEKDHERRKKIDQEKNWQEFNASGKTRTCLPISEIRLVDANSLSSSRQKKLTSPFIGRCFGAKFLGEVVAKITNYYQGLGYVTTQVASPKQNLKSGILELKIIEGKIEKISLGRDRVIEKMQKFTAFGNIEGDALNINEINQGIYQINRLQSNRATMKIEPGSVDGESKIIIENQKKFPLHATVGKDNLGNKFTGVQRTNFSSSLDNLLFLNDCLNVSYTANLHDDHRIKNLEAFSGGISIPFKSNTFSYDFSRSEFKGTNAGSTTSLVTNGFSQQNKFSLDRVLLNKADLRISINSSLTSKSAASYQNGAKLSNSERRLTILNLGFSASSYFSNGTSLYFKPTYILGLTALNAKKDQQNISSSTAKAQFEALKFYASAAKKFTTIPLTFSTEMDSQISKQTLFGSEQFAVGGYYSVRGFKENYVSADSGYYFRNKISFSPGFKITLEPFYDYGYAKNKYDGSSGRLSGAGIKTIFSNPYFNASVTYSKGLSRSHLIYSNVKESKLVYFEISASCC